MLLTRRAWLGFWSGGLCMLCLQALLWALCWNYVRMQVEDELSKAGRSRQNAELTRQECDCSKARTGLSRRPNSSLLKHMMEIQKLSNSSISALIHVKTRASKVRIEIASANVELDVPDQDVDYMLWVEVHGLREESPYTIIAYSVNHRGKRELISRRDIFTYEGRNLVLNPSFEEPGTPPHKGSRLSTSRGDAAQWTPSFGTGYRRLCKVFRFENAQILTPRSGRCHLMLGDVPTGFPSAPADTPMSFGIHQTVLVPPADAKNPHVLQLWFTPGSMRSEGDEREKYRSPVFLEVALTLVDGTIVEGPAVNLNEIAANDYSYNYFCMTVEHSSVGIGAVHIMLFLDGTPFSGVSFIDDVTFTRIVASDSCPKCHRIHIQPQSYEARNRHAEIKLHAEKRPLSSDLTVAVSLTSNLGPRLVSLVKAYDGPFVANIMVRNREEVTFFVDLWHKVIPLRSSVDVVFTFVEDGPIPLNALRNGAVSASRTDYVLPLDLDFFPSFSGFCCFHGKDNILPKLFGSERRLAFVPPQFIVDDGRLAPRSKEEMKSMLENGSAQPYCLVAQSGLDTRKWSNDGNQRYFIPLAQSEPFAIVLRRAFVPFDERFSGYGLNKVSWVAALASAHRFEFFVLPDSFLTHHNHAENDWFRRRNETIYQQTCHRFLSFVADNDRMFGFTPASQTTYDITMQQL